MTEWKQKTFFDMVSGLFAVLYNHLEHLVTDEVILKLKVHVIFKQSVPKKNKHFVVTLCGMTGYTCKMRFISVRIRTATAE
jgi:hypothetical protein